MRATAGLVGAALLWAAAGVADAATGDAARGSGGFSGPMVAAAAVAAGLLGLLAGLALMRRFGAQAEPVDAAERAEIEELAHSLKRMRGELELLTGELEKAGSRPSPDPGDKPVAGAADPPEMDKAALRSLQDLVGGDPQQVARLIRSFLTETPGLLDALDAAVAGGDARTVHRTAHTLRFSGADFGALALSERARLLEAEAEFRDLSNAPRRVADIRAAWAKVQTALQARLDSDFAAPPGRAGP